MGNELFKHMLGYDPFEIARRNDAYPPHNVFQHGNQWKIEVAVAGFKRNELDVVSQNGELVITGEKVEKETKGTKPTVVWQGIATRRFRKAFILEPNQEVIGADYEDGILSVIVEKQKDKENVNRIAIK